MHLNKQCNKFIEEMIATKIEDLVLRFSLQFRLLSKFIIAPKNNSIILKGYPFNYEKPFY